MADSRFGSSHDLVSGCRIGRGHCGRRSLCRAGGGTRRGGWVSIEEARREWRQPCGGSCLPFSGEARHPHKGGAVADAQQAWKGWRDVTTTGGRPAKAVVVAPVSHERNSERFTRFGLLLCF